MDLRHNLVVFLLLQFSHLQMGSHAGWHFFWPTNVGENLAARWLHSFLCSGGLWWCNDLRWISIKPRFGDFLENLARNVCASNASADRRKSQQTSQFAQSHYIIPLSSYVCRKKEKTTVNWDTQQFLYAIITRTNWPRKVREFHDSDSWSQGLQG